MPERIVVALGGNAILQPGQRGHYEEQRQNIDLTAAQLAALVERGYELVLTHGNGPQVGNLLLQNEAVTDLVAPMPLDVLGAMTQGMIGYMLQQSLTNELRARGIDRPVVSVVTQVEVNAADQAFARPTKPVGPFVSAEQARELEAGRGYVMKPDSGRGWRRVVPSPQPQRVVETPVIGNLLAAGAIVVAAGGGGIPVCCGDAGRLTGVEAVVDKDRSAAVLALAVNADLLLILTDVPNVKLFYGTPEERSIGEITVDQLEAYVRQQHFADGSMGPKVDASLTFVRQTGRSAVITSLSEAARAVAGQAGTRILP